ncbi:Pr6Pr family membrane protein [Thalassococcus sp. BH17M4-6]
MSARSFAALIALLAWAVLVMHVQVGLDRRPHWTLWQELWRTGRYFTILTNGLVAAALTAVAAGWRIPAGWAAGLTLWMGIVALVYHGILSRDLSGLRWWTDQGMHSAVPGALALWWWAFAPKMGLRRIHAVWWLGWPAFYLAYALLRGEVDGRHPYFFIDPPRIGWDQVALWILGLGVTFWLLGLGMVALARRLSSDRPRPAGDAPADPRPQ